MLEETKNELINDNNNGNRRRSKSKDNVTIKIYEGKKIPPYLDGKYYL